MRTYLIFAAIVFLSTRVFAGEVNNGAGFSEQSFVFAYSNLEQFFTRCLFTEVCKLSDAEKRILRGIKDSLNEERAKNPYPLFKSGTRKEFDFNIDGALRIAATGSDVGDPIYINVDLIYPKDIDGSRRALRVDEAVAILVHELGHHQGIKDHQALDYLGTKVQLVCQGDVQSLSSRRGEITLTLVNQLAPSKFPNFFLYGLPLVMISNFYQPADVSAELARNVRCREDGQVLGGALVKNLRWKEAQTPSLETRHVLLRACVVSVCYKKERPDFHFSMAQNMEFSLHFVLNSREGRSYYDFDNGSMTSTPVDDWLPCD